MLYLNITYSYMFTISFIPSYRYVKIQFFVTNIKLQLAPTWPLTGALCAKFYI